MKTTLLIGAALLAAATGAPALAQMNNGSMQSNSMQPAPMPSDSTQPSTMQSPSMQPNTATTMSAADTKRMQACQAMSHDAMMKSARCKKMMKMHPEMTSGAPNGG